MTSFDSSQGSTIYERYCVHGVEGMDVSPRVAWTPTCARGRTCGDARVCAERGCDNVMDLEVGTAACGRPQRRGGGYLFRPNRLRERGTSSKIFEWSAWRAIGGHRIGMGCISWEEAERGGGRTEDRGPRTEDRGPRTEE